MSLKRWLLVCASTYACLAPGTAALMGGFTVQCNGDSLSGGPSWSKPAFLDLSSPVPNGFTDEVAKMCAAREVGRSDLGKSGCGFCCGDSILKSIIEAKKKDPSATYDFQAMKASCIAKCESCMVVTSYRPFARPTRTFLCIDPVCSGGVYGVGQCFPPPTLDPKCPSVSFMPVLQAIPVVDTIPVPTPTPTPFPTRAPGRPPGGGPGPGRPGTGPWATPPVFGKCCMPLSSTAIASTPPKCVRVNTQCDTLSRKDRVPGSAYPPKVCRVNIDTVDGFSEGDAECATP